MSTHSIYFHGDIRKILGGYPLLTEAMLISIQGRHFADVFSSFTQYILLYYKCLSWTLTTLSTIFQSCQACPRNRKRGRWSWKKFLELWPCFRSGKTLPAKSQWWQGLPSVSFSRRAHHPTRLVFLIGTLAFATGGNKTVNNTYTAEN